MKTRLKVAGIGFAGFVLATLGFALILQRQALNRVRMENRALQQQVDALVAHADQVAAENQRLSLLIAADQTNAGAPLPEGPSRELLRLRGEVGRLRLEEREVEQSRRDQRQVAQAKLTNAEAELARLAKAHSEKLVSDAELSQAKLSGELLRAEARGDATEASRVRLQQAEEELARAEALRSQSLVSQTEYEQAVRKVESLRAGKQ